MLYNLSKRSHLSNITAKVSVKYNITAVIALRNTHFSRHGHPGYCPTKYIGTDVASWVFISVFPVALCNIITVAVRYLHTVIVDMKAMAILGFHRFLLPVLFLGQKDSNSNCNLFRVFCNHHRVKIGDRG